MDSLIPLLAQYGLAFVFLNVLLQQGSLPLPSWPTLVVASALAGSAAGSWLLLVAVLAALAADMGWYWIGRRYGARMLRKICRLSLSPDNCIRQTENIYLRWGPKSLSIAKFIPGFVSLAATRCPTP